MFFVDNFSVDARIMLEDDRCGVLACWKFFLSIFVYGFGNVSFKIINFWFIGLTFFVPSVFPDLRFVLEVD